MGYLGNKPADSYLTLEKQTFTTSATDTYTLDREVSSVNDIELFLNNVRQEPTEAYTISGTTLTLASAITASDSMYCIYQGRAVGTQSPATGSVTNAMLQNSSITLNGSAVSLGGSASVANTPAFFAYKASGSNQTIANDTYVKVEFNTESFDTDSNFASSRFTPTTAGKYFIFANIALDASSSNFEYGFVAVYKNGSVLYVTNNQQTNNLANHINIPITIIDEANGSTDYYEIYARCADTTGSPVINAGGTDRRCTFGAYKLIGV